MTHDPAQLIAIVGMAGRFPSAPDTEQFWRLLMDRADAIGPVPPDRWDATAQLDPEFTVQAVGGFLDGVQDFDATFFGISPREAQAMDPQQRLMLEGTWRALEDAGVRASDLRGTRTGVYVGTSWHDYETLRKERGAGHTQHTAFGNAVDVIAARVSYFLGLTGPSLTVETGCSSSLVALHLAGRALRAGEISGAVVGGVNLIMAPDMSIGLTHFGGLSPTGRCHAFSASADGFVRGEGVAVVYLKRLDRALADGDRIHGVVVDTAVNNDGGGESLVTPNPDGQLDLLRQVYGGPAVPVDKLAYVEAHGTGTGRGDPIEAGAIGAAVASLRSPGLGPLPIGSVKTNIGHLEPAAGLAGLFKVLLALRHRVVPPSLHSEELNPEIPFDELRLRVVREPLELPGDEPLYMGVNSFGWGGTNAHVVVMSPPRPAAGAPAAPPSAEGGPVVLALSAQSEAALSRRAAALAGVLAEPPAPLAELAGALGRRRDHFASRVALAAADPAGAAEALAAFAADPGRELPGLITGRARPAGRTAFVFPGQGSQWALMGRDLYAADPVFAGVVDRCAAALAPYTDWDLVDVVTGAAGDGWLERVDMVQPTLWAVTVALAEMWRAAGIEPDVVVGHSQGEVSAATVAGILSYEDAALTVARRSQIVRRASGRGRMLAVDLDLDGVKTALEGFEDSVSLAVNNGPRSCVLSGDEDAVLVLKELLDAEGTFCRLVNVDYASHSPQMDDLREDLLAALAPVEPREGRVPLMSTVRLATLAGPEMDTEYWAENLRRPVMFADAVSRLFDEGVTHVVEISPHPILVPAVEELAARHDDPPRVLPTLRRKEATPRDVAVSFARAYVAGLEPFGTLPDAVVPLPGYPWQRDRYWVEARRRSERRGDLAVTLTPAVGEQDLWEDVQELGPDDTPWLRDHKVHEAVVLPGTGMLSLALATAVARTGAVPGELRDVRFSANLTFSDEPVRLSTRWREDIAGGGSFTLSSLAPDATAWTAHATARVLHVSGTVPAARFPESLAAGEPLPGAEFYAACDARGLHYGPSFQGVTSLFTDTTAGEALGGIELPERCLAGARPRGLHPALWDAALQVSLALADEGRTVVPRSVARIVVHQDLAEPVTRVWSHAVRHDATRFDVLLYDAERRPLVTMAGLVLEPLTERSAARPAHDGYRLRFTEQPREETPAGEADAAAAPAAHWAVLGAGGRTPGADRLTAALAAAGAEAGALAGPAALRTWAAQAPSDRPLAVAFLAPTAADGLSAQRAGLVALAELVRACAALTVAPRIAVVTTDAQAATATGVPDPGAALYWGFGRVLRREHPEFRPLLLDVPREVEGARAEGAGGAGGAESAGHGSAADRSDGDASGEDWAALAAAELAAGGDEDQVAVRPGRRLVGRLVADSAADAVPDDAGRPVWRRPERAYRLSPDRPGLWEGLAFRALRRRAPGAGEIEVEVGATALNFLDVMKAMGTYPDPYGGHLLGIECAGTVTAVGPDVAGLAVGDRVVACGMPAIASHLTVRADHARTIPAHLADEQAVTLPTVLATAWHALVHLARLEAGETVLIHSAAGGLGLAAVQIAQLVGARVIATAGSPAKRAYLARLGVTDVFGSRSLDWADDVLRATGGRGVDVVLNSLTGAAISRGLDVLADGGRFVEVGKKDIYGGRPIGLDAFKKGISVSSVDLIAIMVRRPERFARLLADVWRHVDSGDFTPLPATAYPVAEAAEALRAMSHGDHIGKFVLLADPASAPPTAPEPLAGGAFRADGTYLITGGLGALGLSLAEHLAGRGAGALALLGRGAPKPEALERIERLRAAGTRVETYRVDVSDEAALLPALDRIRAELPPLRGVVHAAGLLDDATIAGVRPEQVARVLAPKVDGARLLDAATREDPLDCFVLFSSAAGLIGNAGQAAYAAANSYLDALAVARRRQGLPGLSVQWGPFSDIGLAAAEGNRGARLEERGMGGFTAREAWQALDAYLAGDREVVGHVRLDLRQWFDSYPDTAGLPSWSVLRASAGREGGAAEGNELLAGLLAADPEERAALLETRVRELAGRVLRLDPGSIDRQSPFKSLGLDSLMGLELRNRLESAFGLKLSPTLLWTYGNVRALAGALAERLFPDPAGEPEPAAVPA
ncbi:type I polyketide synthase [Streptomyces sp. HPF1205]|uniref:type I polyketide synthase n=1 Tax=Streptomyces sp. HPF1205 TaxID=2873262 RepID=UPI001CEDF2C4|nr:type I polyketide synthase [Streptomyces sp. HPF1205]